MADSKPVTETRTEWGVRWEWSGGSHIDRYGTEAAAEIAMRKKHSPAVTATLMTRTATLTETPWEVA